MRVMINGVEAELQDNKLAIRGAPVLNRLNVSGVIYRVVRSAPSKFVQGITIYTLETL